MYMYCTHMARLPGDTPLKAHLHGSNLHALECQYLEKRSPKIQDYVISCNSNITS